MSQTTAKNEETAEHIAELLMQLLANTYVLYLKTQNFHWNVVDPRFQPLHVLFEEHYTELAEAIDEIAERIRMIGYNADGTMKRFLELTQIEEAAEGVNGDEMLAELQRDHELIASQLRLAIQNAASFGDEGTADLMIARLRSHEKAAWMLGSHL